MPFMCNICGEESTRICARCTKDSCNNHLCDKCFRCSDCCECEVTLSDSNHNMTAATARSVIRAAKSDAMPDPDSEPEPPHPSPDPDPFPEDDPEAPAAP